MIRTGDSVKDKYEPRGIGVVYRVVHRTIAVFFKDWNGGHGGENSPYPQNRGHWNYDIDGTELMIIDSNIELYSEDELFSILLAE